MSFVQFQPLTILEKVMSIIATVSGSFQVGQESYRGRHVSREFDEMCSIEDVLSWARNELGHDHVSICEIQFSEYTGKSF